MKSLENRILAIAIVGCAALSIHVAPAAAQAQWKGSFDLPTEVIWQNTTLPPGHYTFWMSMEPANPPSRIVLTGPTNACITANTHSTQEPRDRSMIVIEHIGDSHIVSKLYLAPFGEAFVYSVPKPPKTERAAKGPSEREEVLVALVK